MNSYRGESARTSVGSRTRRVLKWATTALAGVVLLSWALSFRWTLSYLHFSPDRQIIEVRAGCVAVWLNFAKKNARPGFYVWDYRHASGGLRRERMGLFLPYTVEWWWQKLIVIPLWIMFLPMMAISTLFWWLGHRGRLPPGSCKDCGYNLTGNVSGRCPECGNAT